MQMQGNKGMMIGQVVAKACWQMPKHTRMQMGGACLNDKMRDDQKNAVMFAVRSDVNGYQICIRVITVGDACGLKDRMSGRPSESCAACVKGAKECAP